jgi:hypothetical protein
MALRRSAEANPLDRKAESVKINSRFQCGGERVLCIVEVDRRRHIATIPALFASEVSTVLAFTWRRCVAKK